jgi:ethanolamine utilization protein EutN
MKLARVIGNVVCTHKEASLEGIKLLLLQPLTEALAEEGEPLVACDTVRAGVGDTVIYVAGREAALALENWFNPADAAVMGIVDRVNPGAAG